MVDPIPFLVTMSGALLLAWIGSDSGRARRLPLGNIRPRWWGGLATQWRFRKPNGIPG
jgi:hypothetical protein